VKRGFIKGEALRLLRANPSKTTFEDSISNFKSRLAERVDMASKSKRVSMGLTVSRKTAKNLAGRRKNERILTVSRKKNVNRKNI